MRSSECLHIASSGHSHGRDRAVGGEYLEGFVMPRLIRMQGLARVHLQPTY